MSLWQRHKQRLFKYGHIYATLFGLVVINYIPERRVTNSFAHRVATVYSHVLFTLLGLVAPAYFIWHAGALFEATDRRWQLQRFVTVLNTFIKFVTVLVTYFANCLHYTALRASTRTCQQLEDAFERSNRASGAKPQRRFEMLLLVKFALLNAMMLVHIATIAIMSLGATTQSVQLHFSLYAFVLWNYTENMANYNYFINCSALKFYQQLNEQLRQTALEARELCASQQLLPQTKRIMQLCCQLCDRLDALVLLYHQIHTMFADGVRMHQLQMLGLVLMTFISNLTNFFTVFNLFVRDSLECNSGDCSAAMALSTIYACVSYADTYLVTLVSELISKELSNISDTMRMFSEVAVLDVRLAQTIESVVLQLHLLNNSANVRICGLFTVDRHLTYLTAAAGLNYFITLVQFDLDWNKKL